MTLRPLFTFVAFGLAHLAVARDHVVLLGTYTGGDSRGIYRVLLNEETGALSTPELALEMANPEFLALHPNGRIVYALTQISGADGKNVGAVAALELDATTARLKLLNLESTGRNALTHLAVAANDRALVAASYSGGYVVSFPLRDDGRIGPVATLLAQTGNVGPNQSRQDSPHPHSVTISPDGRLAFVADLGLDRVFAYRVNSADGSLAAHDPATTEIPAGSGPRHTKFSPDGKSFYVLNELSGTITSARYDAARGAAEPFQNISTLPVDFKGRSTASEVRIHPNGRFVYSANRGHDSIAVFARDPASGALSSVEIVPTGGETPRNFALTPEGNWLLCANQGTNNLTVFRVNAENGRLTPTRQTAQAPKVVCVLFVQ